MSCLQTMTKPLNKLSCNTDKDTNITSSVPILGFLENLTSYRSDPQHLMRHM